MRPPAAALRRAVAAQQGQADLSLLADGEPLSGRRRVCAGLRGNRPLGARDGLAAACGLPGPERADAVQHCPGSQGRRRDPSSADRSRSRGPTGHALGRRWVRPSAMCWLGPAACNCPAGPSARAEDYAVVVGGPMMGRVAADLGEPVTKTTSGLAGPAPGQCGGALHDPLRHIVGASRHFDLRSVPRLHRSLPALPVGPQLGTPRGDASHQLWTGRDRPTR